MPDKYVIIDSDEQSIKTLTEMVERIRPGKEIMVVRSKEKICNAFAETPEVVFIDPMMKGLNGTLDEYEDTLAEVPCVVFMGSDDKLAKDAFDYGALDFVLKPFTMMRMLRSFTRITQRLMYVVYRRLEYRRNPVFVRNKKKLERIIPGEILYIEGLSDYVNIYTSKGKFTGRSTMKNIEALLDARHFVRVHKSYIVRVDAIAEVHAQDLIVQGNAVPLGRMYREEVLTRLKLLGGDERPDAWNYNEE